MFQRAKKYNLAKSYASTLSAQDILKSCSISNLETSTNSPNDQQSLKANRRPFLGIIYCLLCSIFISLTSVFVKKLTYIDPGELSLVRNAGVLVLSLPFAVYSSKSIFGPKEHRFLLVLRGFLGSTALYLNLLAFRNLPLAEAAILMSTLPALVSISARIYLKEPCGLIQTCALVITVAGVLLSIRLPELLKNRGGISLDSNYLTGLGCAVGCVLILSFTFVTVRKLKDISSSVLLVYFGWTGILENGIITGVFSSYSVPRCGWDQLQVALIGIFGFLGHVCLIIAIQTEAAGIVSITKSSFDIIVAMMFQILFFGLIPDFYNIGGATLVMISVAILGLRKWLVTLPKDAKARVVLGWLTKY